MKNQAQLIASSLIQALPYIHILQGKTIVIKYGGNAMTEEKLKQQFASDVAFLKVVGIHPIVVHGGGPQIGNTLKQLGKKPKFVNGIRVTDDETMAVVEKVLAGSVNESIVKLIKDTGGKAIGLSGTDKYLLEALKYPQSDAEQDLGRAGIVNKVNPKIINDLGDSYIPVIAPIGISKQGLSLNINADLAASAISQTLKAKKLLLLTNTKGVLDQEGNLITKLNRKSASKLVQNGTIQDGMLPKINCALDAIANGVASVKIIDGRNEHSTLLELFTEEGLGTVISAV